jgi:hypothetical protein
MTNFDKDKGELVVIRNQEYYIRITMYNNLDKPVRIPFKTVDGLQIEESLVNWWTKGWIVIQNDFEVLERGAKPTYYQDKNDPKNSHQLYLFKFRHDARNKINIRIQTKSDDPKVIEKLWTMDYDFVIYDVQDIETNSSIRKYKKFHFIDERYQIFSERNIPWSTSTHRGSEQLPNDLLNAPIWKRPDEYRKSNPSEAIKSIIETSSSNTFVPNKKGEIHVGYNSSGSIDNPNILLSKFSSQFWNSGDPSPESKVFYTSPANSRVIADLDFMLNHLVGLAGDPVFLRLNRYSKEWELVSIVDYFVNAKQIEVLKLDDGLEPRTNVYVPRAEVKEDDRVINFISARASMLKNYKFAQMAPVDDSQLISSPQHTFDFSTGTFKMSAKNNTILSAYDKIKEIGSLGGLYNFVSNVGTGSQVWMNINKTKSEGISVKNTFVTQGSPKLNMVKMVKDFIFLNQNLYFENEGLTIRTPGNFIFVDRLDSSDKNLFDDKFLGQWFITKVIHYFDKNLYSTKVYSTKFDGINKHWEVVDNNTY